MSGVLHPEGPEPAQTYWLRRVLVLLAVVILVLVSLGLARASSGATRRGSATRGHGAEFQRHADSELGHCLLGQPDAHPDQLIGRLIVRPIGRLIGRLIGRALLGPDRERDPEV